ncbi:MAG: serine hydroxymethyltransferase [Fimbriimonadaceae bacterium]|nr:serine hydroxymethyltransferase [Alphaproteobacteria bacterium]
MTIPAITSGFANSHPSDEVFVGLQRELRRQQNQIELIASENIVSEAVLAAQGSILTNKYAEGYPNRRYYGGCEFADQIEQIAMDRAKQLFQCGFANVQPHSGAQANTAVFLALLEPGDSYLAMSLDHGGHLTHGSPVALSGKWFNAAHYNVSRKDQLIEIEQVRLLAALHRPKVIIAGGSAYPRFIDFLEFRRIADEVGALLMVDMAHFAGLVAAGVYPSPLAHAHVVTTTTHKTLRGPRGGMILTNDETLSKKVNSAVFPGSQGGPLMHVIAAKAVAFGEALHPDFKIYAKNVVANAQILAKTLKEGGIEIVSGGTDCHIVLAELRPLGVTGKRAEAALERAGLTCNKNAVPFDTEKPSITSGIRLGTPAGTTRGFGANEFQEIGRLILKVLSTAALNSDEASGKVEADVLKEVRSICDRFPIYPKVTYQDKLFQ